MARRAAIHLIVGVGVLQPALVPPVIAECGSFGPRKDVYLSDLLNLSEEQRFRLLVSAVTDYAIYMLDPDGRIATWNPGAERFKGYTADEIIGQHFSRFFTPEDVAADLPGRALRAAVRDGRYEAEGWRLRKDGTRFWVNAVIDPIFDEIGQLSALPRSPATSPTRNSPKRSWSQPARHWPSRRNCRRSAS